MNVMPIRLQRSRLSPVNTIAAVTLPFVFHAVALVVDPVGHLGAAPGVIVVFLFSGLPLLSGDSFPLSCREKRHHPKTETD